MSNIIDLIDENIKDSIEAAEKCDLKPMLVHLILAENLRNTELVDAEDGAVALNKIVKTIDSIVGLLKSSCSCKSLEG